MTCSKGPEGVRLTRRNARTRSTSPKARDPPLFDDAEDGAVGGFEDYEVGVRWVGPVLHAAGAQGYQAVDFGLEGGGGVVHPEVQVGAVGFVQVEAGRRGGGGWHEEVGVVGGDVVPEGLAPELGGGAGFLHVEDDCSEGEAHGRSLIRRSRRRWIRGSGRRARCGGRTRR